MPRKLFILGPFNFPSGYNHLASQIVLSLLKHNVPLHIDSRCNVSDPVAVARGFRQLESRSTPEDTKLWIYPLSQLEEKGLDPIAWMEKLRADGCKEAFTPQAEEQYRRLLAGADKSYEVGIDKNTVLFTMWEATILKPKWIEALNKAAAIFVPSKWCANVFKKNGVKPRIYTIPLGVDMSVFRPDVAPYWPDICTFGISGTLTGGGFRKNLYQAISAFQEAFPGQDDVRLRVKISPHCQLPLVDDPRIDVIRAFLTDEQMAVWYRSLTAFLTTSLGEGFGMQPLEAMACGRPIISTAYSGVTEYFDADVGYVIDHSLEPIPADFAKFYEGEWAMPQNDSLRSILRRVYNQDGLLVKRKGRDSCYRACNFSWDKMGERLAFQLRKFLR